MLNPADQALADSLARELPAGTLRRAEPRDLEEPRGRFRGQAGWVAAPRRTDEVAAILRVCAAARVGVVPRGGGTGLVGGQVMPGGPAPLILSLERMQAVRGVHPQDGVMIVEAGAVLADVQAAAAAAGLLFPLSLASEGTARIGGLLATNAGGVNVLRYGNARDLCLGIEAVFADGAVWNGLRRLRKDNTGYDLRNLLIGSEGTLAVITAACLRLFPRPAGRGAALMVVPDPAAALGLLAMARGRLAEGISAFELIGGMGLRFLAETMPALRQPFAPSPEWCVLIDLGLPDGLDPGAALETLFADAADAGLVSDGVIAQSLGQVQQFWTLRESIPEANRLIGAICSHDISLPLGAVPDFIDRAGAMLAPMAELRINCFGHLGDGNLHFNLFPVPGRSAAAYADQRAGLTDAVHRLVDEMGGSVSAEHGVGRLKTADLERFGDPARLAAMRAIKHALDPLGILNPGAVLARVADPRV